MLTVILNFFKELHKSLNKNSAYKVILFSTSMMVISALFYYKFEKDAGVPLTLFDSFWWSFVTLTTVGYGDYFPITLGGRIVATVLMLSGIGTFGFITATVAAVFVDNIIKKGSGKMEVKTKGHIVIIGWNKKADTILKELVNENTGQNIVVVTKKENIELKGKGTFLVCGDEAEDEILQRAHIENASLVLVLADDTLGNEQMMDAKSVLICLAVDQMNPHVHLVSEVMDEKNLSHFKRANVNDTVVTSQISSNIMVRSALYKHVSNTIEELMTNSYGNEFYQRSVSEEEIGKTFSALSNEYIEKGKGVLVGLSDGEKTIVNPNKDYLIKDGDIAIYIGKNTTEK